jgi:EAL domain-containing protein (putative c-di-GMP-specific phosphodiesterase class I)
MLGALHKPVATEQLRLVIERHHAHHAAIAMTARAPRKTYTAADLRDAIANDQLICHFQPKVALRTGKVVGVESLARWQHPTDGLVFPDRFITLAEESGQIDALTQAILRTALRQARVWMTEGIALAVAVNVSMENLVSLDFPEQVEQALLTARIKPDMLILEVTESRLMRDRLASLDILARLRLRHIGLSIDDFGTGHASFEQLRDVPFTELKIDRGFVNGAARDPARRTIFEASLRLAKELGLKTVAEGAEDRDDWNFLRQSGCDLVQGYFVGRPMPGADLSNWITQWEERYRDLAAKA